MTLTPAHEHLCDAGIDSISIPAFASPVLASIQPISLLKNLTLWIKFDYWKILFPMTLTMLVASVSYCEPGLKAWQQFRGYSRVHVFIVWLFVQLVGYTMWFLFGSGWSCPWQVPIWCVSSSQQCVWATPCERWWTASLYSSSESGLQ